MKNKNGVLTFESDMLEVLVASEERHLVVPILRCNGSKGEVTCNYRTERLTAMPGYDYIESGHAHVRPRRDEMRDLRNPPAEEAHGTQR